jgi:hypothetical protein
MPIKYIPPQFSFELLTQFTPLLIYVLLPRVWIRTQTWPLVMVWIVAKTSQDDSLYNRCIYPCFSSTFAIIDNIDAVLELFCLTNARQFQTAANYESYTCDEYIILIS